MLSNVKADPYLEKKLIGESIPCLAKVRENIGEQGNKRGRGNEKRETTSGVGPVKFPVGQGEGTGKRDLREFWQ